MSHRGKDVYALLQNTPSEAFFAIWVTACRRLNTLGKECGHRASMRSPNLASAWVPSLALGLSARGTVATLTTRWSLPMSCLNWTDAASRGCQSRGSWKPLGMAKVRFHLLEHGFLVRAADCSSGGTGACFVLVHIGIFPMHFEKGADR